MVYVCGSGVCVCVSECVHACVYACMCVCGGGGGEGPMFDNKFMYVNIVWFDVV